MTTEENPTISATVEADGEVMIGAADVVAWLRTWATRYQRGDRGGPRVMRKGAHDALHEMADSLQRAYIDGCADEVLETWRPIP